MTILPTRLASAYLSLHYAQPALGDVPKAAAREGCRCHWAPAPALTVLADCGDRAQKHERHSSLWVGPRTWKGNDVPDAYRGRRQAREVHSADSQPNRPQ